MYPSNPCSTLTLSTGALLLGLASCGTDHDTASAVASVTTPCVGDLSVIPVVPVDADDTDPRIDVGDMQLPHGYAVPTVAPIGRLFVFIPGTDPGYLQNNQVPGGPEHYQDIIRTAAARGYHALGLDYLNELPVNQECAGTDPAIRCRERVRHEVLTGVNTWPRPSLVVDRANSIENRLLRLLQHLGWSQFYAGNQLLWSRMVVAGHSQGGGHAAFIARRYEVQRAILFAATEGASWTDRDDINNPFATPASRFYGFSSEFDAVYQRNLDSWENLEIPGMETNVDNLTPPNNGSQRLSTRLDPEDDNHHGTVVLDSSTPRTNGRPDFVEVWCGLLGP